MHYHWLSVLSTLSAVPLVDLVTLPAQIWGDIRVKHTWHSIPADWESLGPPPAGTTIDLSIALKPSREDALIDALYEVSDPGHQKYGAHLTKEQVAELVAPHQDTLEIVHSWLEHHGVPSSSISTSHGGGWLTISDVPVSQADELLCASYQVYRHTRTNETENILRTVGYSLPEALHTHVQTVAPTTHFASPRTLLQTSSKPSGEEAAVMMNATSEKLVRALSRRDLYAATPPYLRWLYKTAAYVPSAMGQNALGILSFQTGSPSQADLTGFLQKYRVDAEAATFTVVESSGGVYDSSHPDVESSVHVQYAAAMTYPTPQIFYSGGPGRQWSDDGRPVPGDPFVGWFYDLFHGQNIPRTISIASAIPEPLLPLEYAEALCNLFGQLGLRGVTVLVTSGDDGVGRGDCKDNSKKPKVRFMPTFPASCTFGPWVTSVGATMGVEPEVGADFSGGGFSGCFPRPKYQEDAVPFYLEFLGIDHVGLYQPEGRGIPDIAARGDNFLYFREDVLSVASGTSGSTAVVAGIVSLLNDYLLSTGKNTLGFLNPLLYTPLLANVKDITRGSNPGCNTDGFLVTHGWDPVTGVGTPDFEHLLDISTWLNPPPPPPDIGIT